MVNFALGERGEDAGHCFCCSCSDGTMLKANKPCMIDLQLHCKMSIRYPITQPGRWVPMQTPPAFMMCFLQAIPYSRIIFIELCFYEITMLTNRFTYRPLPAPWMDRPGVRVLPRPKWLHLSRAGEWSRVPDRPGLRIGCPGPRECRHACFYGLPELFRQWRHAGPQWNRSGAPSH